MLFIRFYKDTQKGHSEDQSGQGLTLIAAQNPVKREKLPLLLLPQLFLGEGLLEGLSPQNNIYESQDRGHEFITQKSNIIKWSSSFQRPPGQCIIYDSIAIVLLSLLHVYFNLDCFFVFLIIVSDSLIVSIVLFGFVVTEQTRNIFAVFRFIGENQKMSFNSLNFWIY